MANYGFTTSNTQILDEFPTSDDVGLQRDVRYGEVMMKFIEDHKNEDMATEFKKIQKFYIQYDYLHELHKKYKKDEQIQIFTVSYYYEKYMFMMIYLGRPEVVDINNIFLKNYNPLIMKNALACHGYVKDNKIREYEDYEEVCNLVQLDFLHILHEKFIANLKDIIAPFSLYVKQHLWWIPFSKLQKLVKTRFDSENMQKYYNLGETKIMKSVQRKNIFLDYIKILKGHTKDKVVIKKIEDIESEDYINNVLLVLKFIEGKPVSNIKELVGLKTNTKIYALSKKLTTQIKEPALKLFN